MFLHSGEEGIVASIVAKTKMPTGRGLGVTFLKKQDFGTLFCVLFTALAAWYFFILATVPAEYQGDSHEYLYQAADFRAGIFWPIKIMRGVAYPAFLATTWNFLGIHNFSYWLQGALFLFALFALCTRVLGGRLWAILPLAVAALPQFAYLQKIAYPDGILATLTVALLVCVHENRRWASIAICILLALTKVVFIFALPVALVVLFRNEISKFMSKRVAALLLIAGAAAGVATVCLFGFVFRDLSYVTLQQRPYANKYDFPDFLPSGTFEFKCNGQQHSMKFADFDKAPITTPYQFAAYGPLREEESTSLACSTADLRQIKWDVIKRVFWFKPLLHLKLALKHFSTALVGGYFNNHASYMITMIDFAPQTLNAALRRQAPLAPDAEHDFSLDVEFDPPLDAGIAPMVHALTAEGVETFESCVGGPGHAYAEPTVRFHGDRGEGLRALAVAMKACLPVRELRRVWPVVSDEPTGPYWELTFDLGA